MIVINGELLNQVMINDSAYGRLVNFVKNSLSKLNRSTKLEKPSSYLVKKRVEIVELHEEYYMNGKVNRMESVVTVRDPMTRRMFNVYDSELLYSYDKEKDIFNAYLHQLHSRGKK
jgi:hypothetical protein